MSFLDDLHIRESELRELLPRKSIVRSRRMTTLPVVSHYQQTFLRPPVGYEYKLLCVHFRCEMSASVGVRYYEAQLASTMSGGAGRMFLCHFTDDIVASDVLHVSHAPYCSYGNWDWTAAGLTGIGALMPIPDVWINSDMVWSFIVGNMPNDDDVITDAGALYLERPAEGGMISV